jgi:hypothetical protein
MILKNLPALKPGDFIAVDQKIACGEITREYS